MKRRERERGGGGGGDGDKGVENVERGKCFLCVLP